MLEILCNPDVDFDIKDSEDVVVKNDAVSKAEKTTTTPVEEAPVAA